MKKMEFDFNSLRSSAPSSPKRLGDSYFSAPSTPTRSSVFFHDFNDELNMIFEENSGKSVVPFDWEDKPGTPKSSKSKSIRNDEFAFDFSAELEKTSLPADELFYGGKIKPLKPPPGLNYNGEKFPLSPKSQLFSKIREKSKNRATEQERGREFFKNSSRRETRSLSPFRDSQYEWEEDKDHHRQQKPTSSKDSAADSSSSWKNRKWSFKNLLLFRSASEGRASDKDPLKKYFSWFKKQDVKKSSLRQTESFNSGSRSKKRVNVSAHAIHYNKNRAVSEDLKKKTFLPYKQGIMGRFSFNPISSGLGTFIRS